MAGRLRSFARGMVDDNPVTVQVLGLCSALAVSRSLATALTMGVALTLVLAGANVAISLLRRAIPHGTRLLVQMTVIASLVIVVDRLLAALAPELSRELAVFVALIVTNCIVLGRTEAFALSNGPAASLLDALRNGAGYSAVLAAIGAVRELLGAGTLLGARVLASRAEGGWFEPLEVLLLPPSAFFLLGALVWLLQRARPAALERRPPEGGAP